MKKKGFVHWANIFGLSLNYWELEEFVSKKQKPKEKKKINNLLNLFYVCNKFG